MQADANVGGRTQMCVIGPDKASGARCQKNVDNEMTEATASRNRQRGG